ncbi:MAG TPA: hypothetical protein VIC27_13600 [Ktedonobacterales bacterium]|jgi:hypothetical protein
MSACMTHTLSARWGISVFITPVARPRPAFGAAWERIPSLPVPIRWRETPCGFDDY